MVKPILLFLFCCYSMPSWASSLSDPTGPWGAINTTTSQGKKIKKSMPVLQAIFVRDGVKVAVMNDKEVQAGDWVSGYKVRIVTDNFVYFLRGDKEYRLSLFSSQVKH